MQFINVNKIAEKWGKYIVQQSRSRLTKGKHNVDKNLYNSLKSEIKKNNQGIDILISMLGYGKFLDKGVRGANAYYADGNTSSSPYSFKSSSKIPPVETLANWAKKRNIRLRNDKGQFAKGNYNTIGFLIARSIRDKGIRSTMFLTRSFQTSQKWVELKLARAVGEDVANEIRETAKKIESKK
tara:strand:- start:6643 stop:7191 length:549 start_codon:yes stop_codon:yes gene_type:complete